MLGFEQKFSMADELAILEVKHDGAQNRIGTYCWLTAVSRYKQRPPLPSEMRRLITVVSIRMGVRSIRCMMYGAKADTRQRR